MKTQKTLQLLCIFVLMLAMSKSYSQFTPAAISDSYAGVTVTTYNTGNDILTFGNDTFKVSVYTDGSFNSLHGIAWEVYYSSSNYAGNAYYDQYDTIVHADVCLVTEGSDVFAVVASYIGGSIGAYNIQIFKWGNPGGGYGFYLDPRHNQWYGTYGTTLNIDGDDKSDFAVVYDDNSQRIYTNTGKISGGTIAINSGNPVQLNNGTNPDISIFSDGGSNQIVRIAYLDNSSPKELYVDEYVLPGNIATGNNNLYGQPLIGVQPTSGFYFSLPRIASPNIYGNVSDFTVVLEEGDHSSNFLIVGFNNNSGSTPIIYNDGNGYSQADLSGANNFGPVVTYDFQGNVWVGWVFDNLVPTYVSGFPNFYTNIVTALYPIVVQCDGSAQNSNYNDYWQVPFSLVATNAVQFLSLAGRNATDRLWLTYYNVTSYGDINTKEVDLSSPPTSLRLTNDESKQPDFSAFESILFSNPDACFTLKLYDLKGIIILNEKGTLNKIDKVFKDNVENIPTSIYLAWMYSDDGKYQFSQKVFIGK